MTDQGSPRAGRRPITSRSEVEHAAFELFARQGFERTTVEDIAQAAGIGRRTFFRYFPSKNDIAWGDFDGELRRMRKQLAEYPPEVPLIEAIREALVDFNRVDPDEAPWHRRRMELILTTPALQAHSTLRYAAWRQVLAEFVAVRLDVTPDSLAPQAIAYATLGVALAAYEQWLRSPQTELHDLLAAGVRELSAAVG
ncbi:mycofactocin system transcriptional regulator [Amycolatopsis acidiphila]|uniref:Mycofactocin system transcriptional regulator n=1 Tax=Amycolatopsis acidiphila TaxID=715473 RepID=A0A558A7F1_9PSEU|nr:mycofactocin system transcriptional regulator [Amycolatopsis acidiphila]TVT20180.1 mycofactocin system transcriptional regulator [Amycolatopsis acidiphila]UIJ58276.1 mycofactocin system transcriptional regulator [Amycolatopsis acidiphila]